MEREVLPEEPRMDLAWINLDSRTRPTEGLEMGEDQEILRVPWFRIGISEWTDV